MMRRRSMARVRAAKAVAAGRGRAPRVVILLENLPLERDSRVKKEAIALRDAGYDVTVIARRGQLDEPVTGIRHTTYPPPPEGPGVIHFVMEYAWSLLAAATLTALELRRGRITVIQACNPPDLYWLIGAPMRALGTRFVFDHHDLSPEVFAARSGSDRGVVQRALLMCERLTYAVSDHAIATNESVRRVALTRGKVQPENVTVVRNGPELSRLCGPPPDERLRDGHRYLVVWVGVIGVDDGVEQAIQAWARLADLDVDALLMLVGEGEQEESCRRLVQDLGIAHLVRFTGWLEQDEVYRTLASADLALALDPPSPRAQHSTMMKVMEYMAAGLPVLAHDIHETKVSAGAAGHYVDNDPEALAVAIRDLLHDPEKRCEMAEIARTRISEDLSWDVQRERYLSVYDAMCRPRIDDRDHVAANERSACSS